MALERWKSSIFHWYACFCEVLVLGYRLGHMKPPPAFLAKKSFFFSYGGWPAIGRLPMKNKSTYLWSTLQPNIKVDTSLNVNLHVLTNGGVGKLVPSLQDDLNNIIWSFFMFGRPAVGRPSNHKSPILEQKDISLVDPSTGHHDRYLIERESTFSH